jgi:hypothetical protein
MAYREHPVKYGDLMVHLEILKIYSLEYAGEFIRFDCSTNFGSLEYASEFF